MVLKPNNGAKRVNENIPPSRTLNQKALVFRLQERSHETAGSSRAKRPRNSGGHSHAAKFAIERSKRRNDVKTKLRFHIKTAKPTDVEMADGTSKIQTRPILLPQELPRPAYKEIDAEIVTWCAPGLGDTNLEYLREHLDPMGALFMQSLSSIRIENIGNKLPKEMTVTIDKETEILPSHILAIFGPQPKPESTKPRQVTLFPVHSLVLAVSCAHLPKPPPMLPVPIMPINLNERQKLTLPVFSLSIPSPESYPHLSQYLYTKQLPLLTRGLLPSMPPKAFLEEPELAEKYAKHLSATFTPQVLVRHVQLVHGFWQNVCALGVFNDALWSAMDVVWKVLLRALGLSTGEPTVVRLKPEPVPVKEIARPMEPSSSSSVCTDASSCRRQTNQPPTPAAITI